MDSSKKYVIIFAKDETGADIKYRFMVSMTKTVKALEEKLPKAVMVDGVDRLEFHGRYTFEIVIARSFDAEAVLAEIEKNLAGILSDIITPKLVV